MSRQLKVYGEKQGDQPWELICLDFDIAVTGEDLDTALRRLQEAVREYLAYVAGLPEADQRRLSRRKAPLGLRWQFAWLAFKNAIRRGGHDDDDSKSHVELLLPAQA